MAEAKETVDTGTTTAEPKAVEPAPAVTYTREALAGSMKYRMYRDALMILLEADRQYTVDEVDSVIAKFINRPVEEKVNK